MKFPSYPKYKESGVEWLGHVPEHWEVRRLRYLFRFISGGTPDTSDEAYWGGNIPWVSPKDMKSFKIKQTQDYVSEVAIKETATSFLNTGSLLVVVRSGILRHSLPVAILEVDAAINQDIKGLIPFNGNIDTNYFGRIFEGCQCQVLSLCRKEGATVESIELELMQNLYFPSPPLPEQHAIAAFLDAQTAKLDTLIAKKRALIAKLKEKRAALITRTVTRGLPPEAAKAAGLDPNPRMKDSGVEWLGEVPEHWEVKPLGYLVRMAGGGTPDKSKAEFWDGDIPWVSPKDMKKPHLFDAEDHITEEAIQNSPVMMLPLNSILIVVRGMILAHSFPVALSKVPLTINQDMKALICLKNILPEFLLFVVSGFTRIFVAFADESAHGTRKIETDIIRRLPIPVPSCDEQRAIISHLEREIMKCDTLITKIESAIAKLQEYRAALITAAVTGKIDVHQNWR